MNIGVIGCGYWGSKHLRVLQSMPEVDRVFAIDSSERRLAELSMTLPAFEAVNDIESILDEVDGAVIATPPAPTPRSHER
jgi:predicted dehydrogenase